MTTIHTTVAAAVLVGALSCCGQSPQVHFYTLSAETPASGPPIENAARGPRIVVGPITIPDVVDRPQFVVRSGQNQVRLVDEHRWAEPLKSDVTKVLAENLGRNLKTEQIWAYPQAAGVVDYRVLVAIQTFESTPGQGVVIDALWTIKPSSQETAVARTGRSRVQEPVAGQSYEAIVAAHSHALAVISAEIAEAIRSFHR